MKGKECETGKQARKIKRMMSRAQLSDKEYKPEKFVAETPALVAKAKSSELENCLKAVKGLGFAKKNDKVLIKVNLNSPDVFPGTSNPVILGQLIDLLQDKGTQVSAGDMSNPWSMSTLKNARTVGVEQVLKKKKTPLVSFEENKFVKVKLPGTSLKKAYVTEKLLDYDHIVNLAVLKTHCIADYTLSMKNLMGIIHPSTRLKMHAWGLKKKIAELNLLAVPAINIIDGTKSFIDGGPETGVLKNPRILFASRDRIALDVTCIKEIQRLGSESLHGLNPWQHPTISRAVELGLGIGSDKDINLIEA